MEDEISIKMSRKKFESIVKEDIDLCVYTNEDMCIRIYTNNVDMFLRSELATLINKDNQM